jgi:VWFA-related protein
MLLMTLIVLGATGISVQGQSDGSEQPESGRASGNKVQRGVRPVTIPISIRQKGSRARTEELQAINLVVREDGEEQRILSIRSMEYTPLSVAVLIQDDVVNSVNNEIKGIAEFIRGLPQGSRVLVGYIRSGSLQIRQKFTTDLERAAAALRAPIGSPSAAAYNPYVEIIEGLRRFESLPAGRRAMLVISDGLDISRGVDVSSPIQSIDLQRAINEAQRHSVAIYSFYAPSASPALGGNLFLTANAQGSLQRLSDETGGRAFFQGTGAPVSFDPYLSDLNTSLTGQLALTYLSTHPKKGFHRIQIDAANPSVEIDHPAGYTRR